MSLKDAILLIRTKFNTATEDDVVNLVELLGELCKTLSTSDQKDLLEQLSDKRLFDVSISEYNQMLSSLDRYGSASFIYLMQAAGPSDKSIKKLALKADYFLSQALPQIRQFKSDSINEVDVVDLVSDLVLAASPEELTEQYTIYPSVTKAYSNLTDAINSRNIEAMKKAITELKEQINTNKLNSDTLNIEGIQDLERHLSWLEKEEYEEFKVTKKEKKQLVIEESKSVQASLLKRFFNFTGLLSPETKQETKTKEIEVDTVHNETRKKIKSLDITLLNKTTEGIQKQVASIQSYTFVFRQTFALIEDMIATYPAAKSMILSLCHHYLTFKRLDTAQITQAFSNISLIHNELVATGDQDLVRSLCEHFGKEGRKEGAFSYKDLIALFQGGNIYNLRWSKRNNLRREKGKR